MTHIHNAHPRPQRCYLNILPKDVIRIIYKYIYDEIPCMLYRYVVKFTDTYNPNYIPYLLNKTTNLLKSSRCKICCKHFSKSLCVWIRSDSRIDYTDIVQILSHQLKESNICTTLINCQDKSGNWNKSFKDDHKFSIINGIVYHFVKDDQLNERYRLVPYFQSDYCWQDLAMRLMRILKKKENSDELTECVSKQVSAENYAKRGYNPGCIIS